MLPRPPPGPLASLPVLHLLLVLPEDNRQSGSQTCPPATRSHQGFKHPDTPAQPSFRQFHRKKYIPLMDVFRAGVQTPSCAAQAGNFCTHPRRVRCVERKPSRKRAVPQAPPTPPTPTRSQPRPRSAGRTVWGCRNATRRSLRGHMAQPLTSSRSPRQGGEAHCPPSNSWEGEGGGTKGPPSHNALRSPPEPTPGCLS